MYVRDQKTGAALCNDKAALELYKTKRDSNIKIANLEKKVDQLLELVLSSRVDQHR